MSATITLGFTASGPDLLAIATRLAAHPAFSAAPPDEASVADRKLKSPATWKAQLEKAKGAVDVSWGEYLEKLFSYKLPYVVSAKIPGVAADPSAAIEVLNPLPFEIAAFTTVHESWYGAYTAPGFARLHALLGWGCAFRGAGHDRLVSRRWLEHGPWRLVRGPGDLSLVQFHDLAADAETALAQAKPGHARMGISETGGFLQYDYVYSHDVSGLYVAAEKLFVITAAEDVSQLHMRDACAVRLKRRNDPKEPIERVAYMFMNEALARKHVHELWLRGLECWTLIDGQKVRLDDSYQPPASKPDWVARLGS